MSKFNMRNTVFDITRALCVLCIVAFWHLQGYLPETCRISNYTIIMGINGILATFTYLSGYFISKYDFNSLANVRLFFVNRFKRFYILFLLSSTTLYAGGWFDSPLQFWGTILGFSSFGLIQPRTLWYFSMMISFYLLTPFLLYRKDNRCIIKKGALLYLSFILGFYVINVDFRLLICFPFYILGFMKISLDYFSRRLWWMVISLCVIFMVGKFINYEVWPRIFQLPLFILCALCTAYCVINLAWFLNKLNFARNVLCKISYASMVAYLFHRHFFFIIQKMHVTDSFILFLLLVVMAVFIFVVSYYMQKIYDFLLYKYSKK